MPEGRIQNTHPFSGLTASLATMHAKERAIAVPFQRHLNMRVDPVAGLDTDQFGTFTGETPRKGTAQETAVHKAKVATELSGLRFGIGSEGSFGPHPQIPFCPTDREVLAFYDRDQNISILEPMTTHRTNYSHVDISDFDDLSEFLKTIKFPSHGVIVSLLGEKEKLKTLGKGVQKIEILKEVISKEQKHRDRKAFRVSTDMRAHMNPTRMGVIRALASRLARRLASLCPHCRTPGFGEKSLERGIPCSLCGSPTPLAHSVRLACISCKHSEIEPLRQSPEKADPLYCSLCNP